MFRSILLTCLLLGLVGSPAFALTNADVHGIASKVLGLNDPKATQAYQVLNENFIFHVDGMTAEARKEIAFRVLNTNKEPVTAAFRVLDALGIFGEAGPTHVIPADKDALAKVREAMERARQHMSGLSSKISTLGGFYVRDREGIYSSYSSQLDSMGSAVVDAKNLFKPYEGRTEPEFTAVKKELEGLESQMEYYYNWWNNQASDNGGW